ncbi:MAG: helix-turn-helix domain-containing protein, partial [Actinomycetota bacterium]
MMSHRIWRRHDDGDAALDEILDAAGEVFAGVGVSKATMVEVAQAARCSRATLYRYFPSRSALQVAYVNRATLRIARRMEASRSAGAPGGLAD